MPISGLVVTFASSVDGQFVNGHPDGGHRAAVDSLRTIPEIEIGESGGSKLAIVVDSASKRRDQEIWDMVQQTPGVIDLAVAMVAFDEDNETACRNPS